MVEDTFDTFDCLLTVGEYYGWGDEIERMFRYILKEYEANKNAKYEGISIPDYIVKEHMDDYIRILWSTMVCEYGNYGTSPQYGWLYVCTHEMSEASYKGIDEIIPRIKEYIKEAEERRAREGDEE